ncbi:MAG: hypothetical protein PWQ10_117 [Patescibacteria group bacterium]|nr:hypothetical protein [Patescibacteria group bacterium]
MDNHKRVKGFTIIEVVLVLAIAGLIFLMVFIALPALQRSQRDTQRKNDLSRLNTALTSYQSNNKGRLPSTTAGTTANAAWKTFVNNYLTIVDGTTGTATDEFDDPSSGIEYKIVAHTGSTAFTLSYSSTEPTIHAIIGASCNGESLTYGQGDRKVAFQMKLEGNGITCVNN